MVKISTEATFRRHAKVVADVDLPDVPAGTEGKVLLPVGLTWKRYHVLFANGEEVANVDGDSLVARDDWHQRQADARRAERKAQDEALAAEMRAKLASGEVAAGGGH